MNAAIPRPRRIALPLARIAGPTAVAILCLLLGACATPQAPVGSRPVASGPAEVAERRGDWARAARAWETAALEAREQAVPPDGLWLRAADAWWKDGDALSSREALERVDPTRLEAADEARLTLLRAEMALALTDLERADFFLGAVGRALPASERDRYRQAQSDLEEARSDPHARVLREVSAVLERMGPPPVDVQEAVGILQRLETVPASRLAEEAEAPTRLGQWTALAMDVRRNLLRRGDMLQAATEWAILNPLHPVDEASYLEIAWQYGQRFTPPGRIAVLVPTTGPLAAAGTAIRDGLVSAWLDHPANSQLTFLDVGEDPLTALQAYREAEAAGYQWVIGPLSREAVQLVAGQPGAALPGLLLNWPEPSGVTTPFESARMAPPLETDFFSLSLSQRAEARAVAERMLRDGHRRTILLLSEDEWGARVEEAFTDAYLAGGGEIVSLERFSAGQPDHSEKLTRLLQIEDGRERKNRLQGLLNIPLEYQDSRRDDFGAFFMAASPALGRQLKPQLRFFDAGSKDVFAMSRVFSGTVDPGADVDLNGVIIPATRVTLEPGTGDGPELASLRGGAFTPLYALGRDAWDILPWLDVMTRNPGFAFPGAIGDLSLGAGGRLLRSPVWAVFRGGRPEALEDGP